MRLLLASVAAMAVAAPASARVAQQTAPPPPVSTSHALPPPTIVHVTSGRLPNDPPVADSVLLVPAVTLTCDGRPESPQVSDDLAVWGAPTPERVMRGDLVVRFKVDPEGRAHDIRPDGPAVILAGAMNEEAQAALAAWRFAPGEARDCSMTLRHAVRPLAEASHDELLRYYAVARSHGELRDLVGQKLGGDGADCSANARNGRAARNVAYPDFSVGRRPPPGGRAWTVVRWDVDTEGRARDVEIIGSSGDVDLDAEARRAVEQTVLQHGAPMKGCVYSFNRRGPALPAPAMPDLPPDPLQNCPAALLDQFAVRAEGQPRAFRERNLEGWARIRFDLASWGAVGNVEVIDAQPAAALGETAAMLTRTGRGPSGHIAGIRCVKTFRFQNPASSQGEPAAD